MRGSTVSGTVDNYTSSMTDQVQSLKRMLLRDISKFKKEKRLYNGIGAMFWNATKRNLNWLINDLQKEFTQYEKDVKHVTNTKGFGKSRKGKAKKTRRA